MKRWILRKNAKSIDDLIQEEVAIPEPKTGEVRIKNFAVSLNFRDIVVMKGTKGMSITRDIIPCSDGAGEIDALGDGVKNWKVGDKVVTQCYRGWTDGKITANIDLGLGSNEVDGTLAEFFIVKSDQIISAPKTLNYLEASTLPCAGTTAWSAIQGNRPYLFPLQKGEKVLILGTGGVSTMAMAIAAGAGAQVYCTTSQENKIETLKSMGIKDVINYRLDKHWGDTIYKKTQGVDLVVNTVGLAAINSSIRALNFGGRMSMVGAMDDTTEAFTESYLMMRKNNILFGVLTASTEAFKDYINFLDEKKIKPYIQQIYDFDNVKEAFKTASYSKNLGKIVIRINHQL